jgi:hypothetical protein
MPEVLLSGCCDRFLFHRILHLGLRVWMFKSPGYRIGKFCVGVKSPLQNLITNYELRII